MNPCFPKFPSREWRKHPLLVILYSLFLILCSPCCLHSRVLVLVLCSLYIALYSQKNLNSIHSLAPQFAQPTWNLPSCEFLFAMSYKAMQYYYHLKCWLCEWMTAILSAWLFRFCTPADRPSVPTQCWAQRTYSIRLSDGLALPSVSASILIGFSSTPKHTTSSKIE